VIRPLAAFAAFGIEIEYMIVDRSTLAVAAIADRVLEAAEGVLTNETEQGALAWSNELALHVIELKTNGPTADLAAAARDFQTAVVRIDELLEPFGARLMPSAAHPWMDPDTETRLWPHDDDTIYRAYDRIFGCKGHGWSNLQSMHVNLPFADDREFGRLHAAVRAVLPILPALAASSPFLDGVDTGFADGRLDVYARNQARIPSIAGQIVPEPVTTAQEYAHVVFEPMYRDIAPFDPEGTLQNEWLNSRGAIARFDRSAIEIRLLDTQEHPAVDLAIAMLVTKLIRRLFDGGVESMAAANAVDTAVLSDLLRRCIVDAEAAIVDAPAYLALFGIDVSSMRAGELWSRLAAETSLAGLTGELDVIFAEGTLATRLRKAAGAVDRDALIRVYGLLCDCLATGTAFRAGP